MSLAEIEKKHIEPLIRAEKEQLIKDIQRMLDDELLKEQGVVPGAVYEIHTPNITTDDSELVSIGLVMEQLKKDYPHAF
ncbi:MAG: hypothetical protein GY801_08205 [bacterium]|nr:hypothetical protein [bacterium]